MELIPTKSVAISALVFLLACRLCMGTIQGTKTKFTKGKRVATRYMTLQSYSDIKCVRKCFDEKKQNRCSVAGYNVATKTCLLSNDNQTDLLDTTEEEFGVFLFSDSKGMFSYK